MTRTPIDELARQAGQAVRERADQVDRHRPAPAHVRRRHRIRRRVAAGTVALLVVASLVVFVQGRPASVPTIGDGAQPSENPLEGDPSEHDTPQAVTSPVVVADGVFEGSDRTWTMSAWLTEDDGICLQLKGTACGAPASEGNPLGFVGNSTTSAPEENGCEYGTVNDQVATVEIDFLGGHTEQLTPFDGGPLPTDFYAFCWDGHRRPLAVRAIDEHGNVLATGGPTHRLETANGEPVQPGTTWYGPDDRAVTDDIINLFRGPEHCDWQDAMMLHVGWPIGSDRSGQNLRQYVRDPNGVLPDDRKLADYLERAELPPTAQYSGYHTGTAEIWTDPATEDQLLYVVGPDRVERWPRTDPPILCA